MAESQSSKLREWIAVRVRAILPAELAKQEPPTPASHLESLILRLPFPVMAAAETFSKIFVGEIDGEPFRLYPPFPIDVRGEASGTFKRAWIPRGQTVVTSHQLPDEHAALGLSLATSPSKETHLRQGLRIDIGPRHHYHEFIHRLIEQISQHTFQWWLSSLLKNSAQLLLCKS